MAFPVRLISEVVDSIVIELDEVPKSREFVDWMTSVSIYSEVDCYVRFNEETSKEIPILANMVFNFFFPIKKIIAYSTAGNGRLYAWGEKI